MPAAGGYITAYFDDWCYENCWIGSEHYGLDFGMTTGTDVYATMVQTGTIASTGTGCSEEDCTCNRGMGNFIKLQAVGGDGQTWTAIYMHLENIYVSTGDIVSGGDVIGTADNTGCSTGSHLHYEIRDSYWDAVDPYCTIWSCPYTRSWPSSFECSACPE
jgi:murein DD-endopeptidase MepM/ murein hydrolase activator NlpD